MEISFQIDYIFSFIKRNSPHLIIRQLGEQKEIIFTENSVLNNYPIKRIFIPRALDKENKPRVDLFVIELKNKSDLGNFEVGQIVFVNVNYQKTK